MEWYYAQGQERIGPIDGGQLRDLVAQGTIREETLIWNADLPNWIPYGQVVNPVDAEVAAPDQVAAGTHKPCVQCGQSFPAEHLLHYEGQYICAACKPLFFQRIQEVGAPTPTIRLCRILDPFYRKIYRRHNHQRCRYDRRVHGRPGGCRC